MGSTPLGGCTGFFLKKLFSNYRSCIKDSKWGRKYNFMNCTSRNGSPQQIPFPFENEAKTPLPLQRILGLICSNGWNGSTSLLTIYLLKPSQDFIFFPSPHLDRYMSRPKYLIIRHTFLKMYYNIKEHQSPIVYIEATESPALLRQVLHFLVCCCY